jgi:glycine cleavage system H protein
MMTKDPNNVLELTVDKFIFRFPRGLRYSETGLWIKQEGSLLRIGMSDFVQQRNGDIAFATLMPEGTFLGAGDEIGSIETVKVNMSIPAPVKGTIVEINLQLKESPELINQEPYDKGWLVVLQPENLEQDLGRFLSAEAYCNLAKQQAEAEMKS